MRHTGAGPCPEVLLLGLHERRFLAEGERGQHRPQDGPSRRSDTRILLMSIRQRQ